MNYHLDFETRSKADLSEVGAYRYAEDESTEILMFAIASDTDPEPILWVPDKWAHLIPNNQRDKARDMLWHAISRPESCLVYAHNAQFERAMMMFRGDPDLQLPEVPAQTQWRCTAAMARKASLPDSLERIGAELQLTTQKDKVGKELINLFSIPDKNGNFVEPDQFPEKFKQFGQYCCTDVKVEQLVHKKLAAFELKGLDLATFQLDIRLNDRGIPVNVKAAANAARIIDEMMEIEVAEFDALTGGLRPTQRAKVKELIEAYGVPMLDMKQPTLEAAIESIEEDIALGPIGEKKIFAYQVLQAYAELNYGGAKKVYTILKMANKDGRVRGTLMYHGAGTGRWAGRGIQPQNFKKPSKRHKGVTDLIYQMICDDCTREQLELVFGNPLDAIASCIRNFIQRPEGPLLDADFASIEARIVCWLAGDESACRDFAKGVDQYVKLAATIFDKTADLVDRGFEREVGKRGILGCGFGMGPDKFVKSCAQYGVTISLELAQKAVKAYRKEFKKVADLWSNCDDAMRKILVPDFPDRQWENVGRIGFTKAKFAGKPYMAVRLPSGRILYYPEPRLDPLPAKEQQDVYNRMIKTAQKKGKIVDQEYLDQTRKYVSKMTQVTYYGELKNNVWGRVKLYGGKIVENFVQACAADFMSIGSQNAEKEGFVGITLVHDQNLSDPRSDNHQDDLKVFIAALTKLEQWADGCPIQAEGKVAPYYSK